MIRAKIKIRRVNLTRNSGGTRLKGAEESGQGGEQASSDLSEQIRASLMIAVGEYYC